MKQIKLRSEACCTRTRITKIKSEAIESGQCILMYIFQVHTINFLCSFAFLTPYYVAALLWSSGLFYCCILFVWISVPVFSMAYRCTVGYILISIHLNHEIMNANRRGREEETQTVYSQIMWLSIKCVLVCLCVLSRCIGIYMCVLI